MSTTPLWTRDTRPPPRSPSPSLRGQILCQDPSVGSRHLPHDGYRSGPPRPLTRQCEVGHRGLSDASRDVTLTFVSKRRRSRGYRETHFPLRIHTGRSGVVRVGWWSDRERVRRGRRIRSLHDPCEDGVPETRWTRETDLRKGSLSVYAVGE